MKAILKKYPKVFIIAMIETSLLYIIRMNSLMNQTTIHSVKILLSYDIYRYRLYPLTTRIRL